MNSLRRLREQQSLSVKFITRVLKLSDTEYYECEKASKIKPELLEMFTRLFGVEESDIISEQNENTLDLNALGFARTASDITPKDQRAIEQLIKLRTKFNQ
ncbi:hypothetical protein [Carnobacterium maltaromaticum]|uniref:hypothetical protein n=1 Tax=Carnobacterium maltaromaticum TaxID=2751 RepID=UPI0012FAC76F|nr:hypothetical protein [Carnobacterium maltaromaticum]